MQLFKSYSAQTGSTGIRYKSILAIVLLLIVSYSYAQDIHYSQFVYSPLNLNASLAGVTNADYRFSLHHRQQWNSVSTPFQTFSLGFDSKIANMKNYKKQIALGFQINSDKAGDGDLTSNNVALSVAYAIILNDSSTQISFGLQAGVISRSINFQKLYFDSQFDGDLYNPSLPNNENFATDNHTVPDAGIGITLRKFKPGFEWIVSAGASHLNRPSLSYYNNDGTKLPVHYSAVTYATIGMSESIFLKPSLLYMRQNTLSEFTFGLGLQFDVSDKEALINMFDFGLNMRTGDAVFINVGANFKNLYAGFSYDVNISGLERASNYKGAMEAVLVYQIFRVKKLNPSVPCLVY